MARSPETRNSLILWLPIADDAIAWREFTAVYKPLVYQFARRRGLQDADAQELVQNFLFGVAQSVERWTRDPQRGKFRAWLFRIARNQLLHLLAKRERTLGQLAQPDIGPQDTRRVSLSRHRDRRRHDSVFG